MPRRGKGSKFLRGKSEFNVPHFKRDIKAFQKKYPTRIEVVIEKIAIDIWIRTTKENPVRTGYSRANWMVGIDNPNLSTVERPAKGVKLPPPPIPEIKASIKNVIYITNNTEYILPLEFGHSQDAPAGMLRQAIAETMAELRTYIELAKNRVK